MVNAALWCLQRGSVAARQRGSARAAAATGVSPDAFCVGHSGAAEPALRAMR